MSIKKGLQVIASSVPVTSWGSVEGTITDQADLNSVLAAKANTYSPEFTGIPLAPTASVGVSNNQIATTKYVQNALISAGSDLPDQTGQSGKFLTTNGLIPSWESVDALPSQSGNNGKFLKTNGTSASWATIDLTSKVDKVTSTSSKNRVYIVTPAGAQSVLDAEQTGQTASTIPIRTAAGTVRTADPSDNKDAVNLSYLTSTYDAGVVHKTGDEEIAGTKTFTDRTWFTSSNNIPVSIKDSNLGIWETPSSDTHKFIGILDKGNNIISYMHAYKTIAGDQYLELQTTNSDNNSTLYGGKIGIKVTNTGVVTTYAPTPASDSNDTNIATTAWVNTKLSSTALTNGADISIDSNNAINFIGPKYYRLATKTWTYAQWSQYCERGVTTTVVPSFTVTGIKTGDLVSVEGICSDRNNASVLAWGIAQNTPTSGGNVSVSFLGLNIQENTNKVIYDLFDHKWVDYELSDQSWVKTDTFNWQSGTTYSDAYNHLTDDISDATYYDYDLKIVLNSSNNKYMLTLAAGSTVTGPSGNSYTLKTTPGLYGRDTEVGEEFVCFKSLGSGTEWIEAVPVSAYYIQDTQPVNPPSSAFWYDTANNVIKTTFDGGTQWYGDFSYPLGKYINRSSNGFNGPEDLIENYSGIQGLVSETIGSYTIKYYPAPDGHKIVMPDQETIAANIFSESGIAWYYILDTDNTRFKLPRTKFEFTGLRDGVGNYVSAGLPNITGKVAKWNDGLNYGVSGPFYVSGSSSGTRYLAHSSDSPSQSQIKFDASRSSSIYGASTTVQPPATQQYLYFYVGQFSQTATEQTAGLNASLFNNKADLDLNGIETNIGSPAKKYFAKVGMPGSSYENITLGESNSTYTVSKSGYVQLVLTSNGTSALVGLSNITSNLCMTGYLPSGNPINVYVPVKAGDTIQYWYSGCKAYGQTYDRFQLIYAEGEEN